MQTLKRINIKLYTLFFKNYLIYCPYWVVDRYVIVSCFLLQSCMQSNDCSIFQKTYKYESNTGRQPNIESNDVWYIGQGCLILFSDYSEQTGDSKSYSCWNGIWWYPESKHGHKYNKRRWDINICDVVSRSSCHCYGSSEAREMSI